jgi:hypothetical protein
VTKEGTQVSPDMDETGEWLALFDRAGLAKQKE